MQDTGLSEQRDGNSQFNAEMQYKVMVTLLELEQSTAEFIDSTGLDAELPNAVRISRCKFIRINDKLIKHLEKIQLQGYHFEELISTLKLETKTLKKESRLS
ncbi:MAG: hypothetical protein K2H19_09720 [Ruminococcus sp.]|nr:hypothetical protein [Ruminococcus sp.]